MENYKVKKKVGISVIYCYGLKRFQAGNLLHAAAATSNRPLQAQIASFPVRVVSLLFIMILDTRPLWYILLLEESCFVLVNLTPLDYVYYVPLL